MKCGLGRVLHNLHKYDAGLEFEIVLVINKQNRKRFWFKRQNNESTYLCLKNIYPSLKEVYFRNNDGFDIGAYAFGLKKLQLTGYEGDVVLMNSSVSGPSQSGWLLKYHSLFHSAPDIGLCGCSLNSRNTNITPAPFMPHVQSFFLYSKMKIFQDLFPQGLSGANIQDDKIQLILEGEIEISTRILNSGYSICCSSFPNFLYRNGDKWTIPEGDFRCMKEYSHLANCI